MMWSVTDPIATSITRLRAAAAAALGSAVDVVGVLVERPGRLVGRVRTIDGEFVVKVEDGRDSFAAEQRAMTRLRAAGLPVGEVVDVDTGPPAVLVARWIPGRGVTAADPPEVLADVGRLLRRVHDMPAGSSYSGRPSISAWIGDWLTIVLGWWGRSETSDGPPARRSPQRGPGSPRWVQRRRRGRRDGDPSRRTAAARHRR